VGTLVEGLLMGLEMEARRRGICPLWGLEVTVYRRFLPLKIRRFECGFLHLAFRLLLLDVVHHSMGWMFGAPEAPVSYFRPLSL